MADLGGEDASSVIRKQQQSSLPCATTRNPSSSSSTFFSANQSPFFSPKSNRPPPPDSGNGAAETSSIPANDDPSSFSPCKPRSCDVYIGFHGRKPLLLRFTDWLRAELELQGFNCFAADRARCGSGTVEKAIDSCAFGVVVLTKRSFRNPSNRCCRGRGRRAPGEGPPKLCTGRGSPAFRENPASERPSSSWNSPTGTTRGTRWSFPGGDRQPREREGLVGSQARHGSAPQIRRPIARHHLDSASAGDELGAAEAFVSVGCGGSLVDAAGRGEPERSVERRVRCAESHRRSAREAHPRARNRGRHPLRASHQSEQTAGHRQQSFVSGRRPRKPRPPEERLPPAALRGLLLDIRSRRRAEESGDQNGPGQRVVRLGSDSGARLGSRGYQGPGKTEASEGAVEEGAELVVLRIPIFEFWEIGSRSDVAAASIQRGEGRVAQAMVQALIHRGSISLNPDHAWAACFLLLGFGKDPIVVELKVQELLHLIKEVVLPLAIRTFVTSSRCNVAMELLRLAMEALEATDQELVTPVDKWFSKSRCCGPLPTNAQLNPSLWQELALARASVLEVRAKLMLRGGQLDVGENLVRKAVFIRTSICGELHQDTVS